MVRSRGVLYPPFLMGRCANAQPPPIDVAAERFNVKLDFEDKDKIEYKMKTRQFVKVYGQMTSIMPFEMSAWEKPLRFL